MKDFIGKGYAAALPIAKKYAVGSKPPSILPSWMMPDQDSKTGAKKDASKKAPKKGFASGSMSCSLPDIFNGSAPVVAALGIQNGKRSVVVPGLEPGHEGAVH
jgi:hypothetical protein